MDIGKNFVLAISSMIASMIIIYKFHYFFKWENGDNFKKYIERAFAEYDKDVNAKKTMFGSRKFTLLAHSINMLFAFVLYISLSYESFKFLVPILMLYLLLGFFISSRPAAKYRTPSHSRLLPTDKAWYRFYYAITWPLYLRKNKH